MKKYLTFIIIASLISCQNVDTQRISSSLSANNITMCSSFSDQRDQLINFSKMTSFSKYHPVPTEVKEPLAGKMIAFSTPNGKPGTAYFLEGSGDHYLLMFHEWWGLNDHIKREAERYFQELGDVSVMALDMYDGKIAENPETARQLTQSLSDKRLKELVKGALSFAGDDTPVATIGWCFGGSISLQAALIAENQAEACVVYYGMPVQDKSQLKQLQAPILGIFASEDTFITPEIVKNFSKSLDALDKKNTIKMYDAHHAFANPTGSRYNEDAAKDAYQLTINFLKESL